MPYRYSTTKYKTDELNQLHMETTIYPRIKASNDDLYIIATASDRLDLLAKKYYNDPNLWWIIAAANNINDATLYLEPGQQLRIPPQTQRISSQLVKANL